MSENTKNKRKLIVTSALPYANSSLHLGHILEAVQTDIWVRFQNQNLNECLYFCADDTHGTPVMLKAQELGLSPEELIKNVKKDHIETYEKYGIDFTNFHSTHSDENKKIAQEIYMSAKENGLIKKKVINQLYDTKESMFLSDRFIKGTCPKCSAEDQYGDGCGVCNAAFSVEELINPISTLSNTKPILKESEHIFFDLPSKSEYIKKFLSEATLQEPIINKLHEWVGDGLKEWDISRDAPYFGFQIPNEPNKFFYVWLDAPIGYIASAMNWSVKKNIDISDLWFKNSEYEIHHFIGKDISYFHGLFWPALLESSKYKLPDGIHVHGFLTLNGEKMSKSLGNFAMLKDLFISYHPEVIRYYLVSSHYRSSLNFDQESLNQARSALTRLYQALTSMEGEGNELDQDMMNQFSFVMNDDLNTPEALSLLFQLAKSINNAPDPKQKMKYGATLKKLSGVLGLLQDEPKNFFQFGATLSDEEIGQQIALRNAARDERDFQTADKIRDSLIEQGIILDDSSDGTTWKKS